MFSDVLPAFTCASAFGNVWNICLGNNTLNPCPCAASYLSLCIIVEQSSKNLMQ